MAKRKTLTSSRIALVLSAIDKKLFVQEVKPDVLWFLEDNEPFAEIRIDGTEVVVRLSAHCSAPWGALTVSVLVESGATRVAVNPEPFIQTEGGGVLYGAAADHYHRTFQELQSLRSLRSLSTKPN